MGSVCSTVYRRLRPADLIGVLIVVCLCGCLPYQDTGFGTITTSRDAGILFESLTVLPDYQYYYSGSDAKPDAIIGIRNGYLLATRYWKPVRLTPDRLDSWIDSMAEHRGYTLGINGGIILDSVGEKIGIWYSPFDRTRVRMVGKSTVSVFPPIEEQGLLILGFGDSGK